MSHIRYVEILYLARLSGCDPDYLEKGALSRMGIFNGKVEQKVSLNHSLLPRGQTPDAIE